MMASRVAIYALLGLAMFAIIPIRAPPASAQGGDEWVEIGRGRNYIEYQWGDQCKQEIFGGPIFTQADNGDWVSYVFEDLGDRYVVKHPNASVKFFDYYATVWSENFEDVVIYDDRWTVEYLNKQGNWTDTSFWNIVRSYKIDENELRIIRTGSTVIGQRKEIYAFRRGSPVKITIEQTCDSAQTIRFVWKPSGIVATAENVNKDEENRTSHLTYWSENNWVGSLAWFDELEVVENIDVLCESHAQGRKATITFESFEVAAGGMAVLDPTETFWSTTKDGFAFGSSATTYQYSHDRTTGTVWYTPKYLHIGQEVGAWRIYRAFVFFGTTSIPDNATITSATLSLYGNVDNSNDDFNVVIQNGQPTYPHDPIETGDYYYVHYSGNGGSFNTSSFTTSGYNDITLNENARENWIRKDNTTKFALRSENDIDNIAPTDMEYINVYSSEMGSGYQPKLTITWETGLPQPYNLRVENQVSPQRLIAFTPEFSFIYFDNDADNSKQAQIQVGTSAGDNSMWDNTWSVNVENGSTITKVYASDNALSRGIQYWWRVKVQDNTDNWGEWSENENFRINQPPTCSITAPPDGYDAEIDEGIGFTSSASDPDGDSVSYHWDFGDFAGTSTQQNPSYSYSTSGDYTVALYVSDGYESSATKSITVVVGGGAPPPPSNGGDGGVSGVVREIVDVIEAVAEPAKNPLFRPILSLFGFGISPLILLGGAALISHQIDQRGIMWASLIFLVFLFTMGSRIFG